MLADLGNFHFLRSYFLWLFIPAVLLIYWLWKNQTSRSTNWRQVISPHLLDFLMFKEEQQQQKKSALIPLALMLGLLIFAISGPSWRQKQLPVIKNQNAQVVMLDLSLSMQAEDIKPSRLERAKYKLLDLLKDKTEGNIALIVYAGDAFVVSPLTSDARTIANIVPTLSTNIMPVLGSRADLAIGKAIELLQNNNLDQGEIIWFTDGVEDDQAESISQKLKATNYQLSILGIGSEQGAPIPLPNNQGFLTDNSGNIVLPKYQPAIFQQLARQTNAGYIKLSNDRSDLNYLQKFKQWQYEKQQKDQQQTIPNWADDGYWLIFIIIGVFLFKLIRQTETRIFNLLGVSLILSSLLSPQTAQAFSWDDLWLTKNQQAKKAFDNQQYEKAEKLFQNKQWQAAAQYKNGEYADAAKNFDDSSIRSLYNHATSLAKAGKLAEALQSYQQLLQKQADHQDALHNKKIIEDLLKQQQQQEQQQNQNQQDNNQQGQDQQSQNQQNQDQQNQNEQQADQSQQQQDKQTQTEDSQSKDSQSEDSQSEDRQSKKDQQEKTAQPQEQQNQSAEHQQNQQLSKDNREKSEKDQALDHWLEKIQDDPGGLLRNKMLYEYQRRKGKQTEEKIW